MKRDAQDMAHYALRYAIGRRTYCVGEVCRYITNHLDEFEYAVLQGMYQDLHRAKDFGMDCDKADWMQLKSDISFMLQSMIQE